MLTKKKELEMINLIWQIADYGVAIKVDGKGRLIPRYEVLIEDITRGRKLNYNACMALLNEIKENSKPKNAPKYEKPKCKAIVRYMNGTKEEWEDEESNIWEDYINNYSFYDSRLEVYNSNGKLLYHSGIDHYQMPIKVWD